MCIVISMQHNRSTSTRTSRPIKEHQNRKELLCKIRTLVFCTTFSHYLPGLYGFLPGLPKNALPLTRQAPKYNMPLNWVLK